MAEQGGIEKAVRRKERNIKRFADAKSQSIAISSAFNGAAEIVNTLVKIGRVGAGDFWKEHDTWYHDYLNRFLDEQEKGIKKIQEQELNDILSKKPNETKKEQVNRLHKLYMYWKGKDDDRADRIQEAIKGIGIEGDLLF